MFKNCQANLQQLAFPSISLIILAYLGLQAGKAFGGHAFFPQLCPDPCLWPFLTYPMYSRAHYEGAKINRYSLIGTLENSTEVPIRPEDLDTGFWIFHHNFIYPLIKKDDPQTINKFVALYQSKQKKKLIGLRLENHPISLTKEGGIPSSKQVIKTIRLEDQEE